MSVAYVQAFAGGAIALTGLVSLWRCQRSGAMLEWMLYTAIGLIVVIHALHSV